MSADWRAIPHVHRQHIDDEDWCDVGDDCDALHIVESSCATFYFWGVDSSCDLENKEKEELTRIFGCFSMSQILTTFTSDGHFDLITNVF